MTPLLAAWVRMPLPPTLSAPIPTDNALPVVLMLPALLTVTEPDEELPPVATMLLENGDNVSALPALTASTPAENALELPPV